VGRQKFHASGRRGNWIRISATERPPRIPDTWPGEELPDRQIATAPGRTTTFRRSRESGLRCCPTAVNNKVWPPLLGQQLKTGARIVGKDFDFRNWTRECRSTLPTMATDASTPVTFYRNIRSLPPLRSPVAVLVMGPCRLCTIWRSVSYLFPPRGLAPRRRLSRCLPGVCHDRRPARQIACGHDRPACDLRRYGHCPDHGPATAA